MRQHEARAPGKSPMQVARSGSTLSRLGCARVGRGARESGTGSCRDGGGHNLSRRVASGCGSKAVERLAELPRHGGTRSTLVGPFLQGCNATTLCRYTTESIAPGHSCGGGTKDTRISRGGWVVDWKWEPTRRCDGRWLDRLTCFRLQFTLDPLPLEPLPYHHAP